MKSINHSISKPYPRKGTETSIDSDSPMSPTDFKTISPQGDGNQTTVPQPEAVYYFKTISPQGDGNVQNFINNGHFNYFKTISPQGDGNEADPLATILACKISKPYPRKGTETKQEHSTQSSCLTFQNHIPARGRKHLSTMSNTSFSSSFQNHIPARGRKPATRGEILAKIIISKPYPRKGTETR